MSNRKKMLLRAACVAALSLAVGGAIAAADDQAWPPAQWPSTLSRFPAVGDRLAHTDYTPEEKRNLMTVMKGLSPEFRPPQPVIPAGSPVVPRVRTPGAGPRRQGWAGLFDLTQGHDYSIASTSDRVDKIEDIIAKGNTVWGVFKSVGHHTSSMFGFPGDGRPIDYREMFYRTFDDQGKGIDSAFRAEELEIYLDLGGKVHFPDNAAAIQKAAKPIPNSPKPFMPYSTNPFGQKPTWTAWPPAQWPDTVRNPALIKKLTETKWTPEEKRNLQTMMDELVFTLRDPSLPPPPRPAPRPGAAPAAGAVGLHGFDGLNDIAGFRGYNAAISMPDRRNEIEEIIAKGNRVWVVFAARGTHAGPFYGFAGTGKPIMWRELGYGEYDNAGHATHMDFRSEELELYVALGGKVQFPGKPPVPDTWAMDEAH